MPRTYYEPTESVGGYPLDAWWAVVEPPTADITNLVANPSVETNTTGYTASSSAIARVITEQRRGAYSLEVTPSAGTFNGVYYGTVTTVAGGLFNWSFDFLGTGGKPYRAYWADTAGTRVSSIVAFTGKGEWDRIQVPWIETSSTTRRLYVTKNGAAGGVLPFYIDGMLVPSTVTNFDEYLYFDGDSLGYIPLQTDFYWTGTPHGSTSVMRAHTRAGGIVRPLAELGFSLLAMLGVGLPNPQNVTLALPLAGGEQYQRTLAVARSFDLVGTVTATSLADLQRKHRELERLLDVRRQPYPSPLTLLYHPVDECGVKRGEQGRIVCSLEGGLDGQRDNHYQENLDLRFRVHLPYISRLDGTEGAALDVRDEIADARYVVRRDTNKLWSDLQTGLNGTVHAALPMPDGRWLLGGEFTNAGGVADADYIAYYDPSSDSFSAVNATPLANIVNALVFLSDGNVLVGGLFTNAGGDANADFLCRLTVTTGVFSSLNATPLNLQVLALEMLPDYTVAVGGLFTNAGGDANADYLARLTLSTGAYSAFNTTPLNAQVEVLEELGGYLYVGGDFTNAGGDANSDYIVRLLVSTGVFSSMSIAPGVLNAPVRALKATTAGLMIGGDFTNVFGDTTWDYLAVFGGGTSRTYQKVFGGLSASVLAIAEPYPGQIWVGGAFLAVEGVTLSDGLFAFSGTTLLPIDYDHSAGGSTVNFISARANGELLMGTANGIAYTSGTTVISNTGSADAFPVIVISYSASATAVAPLYSIRNLTTGQTISFNLSLLPGETLTIDLRSGKKTVTSSIRGDLSGLVLPGSPLQSFRLLPGSNRVNIFIDIASAANASAYAYWSPAYVSLDNLVP